MIYSNYDPNEPYIIISSINIPEASLQSSFARANKYKIKVTSWFQVYQLVHMYQFLLIQTLGQRVVHIQACEFSDCHMVE
jgi:hypothetical protein